ncbi:zf-HC2 domain-containing protein [uncultured Anaerococcus sp.]|uniref:zf-HC2 domain-containing protein n=1 Tax=uncultured Anaerococcus sp. TaxID=293428 RepID=UPI002804DC06|nr:zf-HC2 domain-containing protein [uncultured Anaerococcus sp.]
MNNCQIIKDLLPLYKEELLSEESKTFVENHLKTCPECENLLKDQIQIEIKETKPLDFVEKRIKKESRYFTLAVLALIGSILIFIISYLNTPRHFEHEKDLYKVYKSKDIYTVEFSDKVSGIDYIDTEDAIYLDAYTTKYDEIFNKERPRKSLTFHKDKLKTVLYQNHESMPNMVIGSGEVRQTLLPRLFLGFYARLSIIGFVGLGLLIFLIEKIRKKSISLTIKTLLIGGPLALFLAIIGLKGLNTSTYYPVTDFKYIAFLALGIYLFFIFLSLARDQKRM